MRSGERGRNADRRGRMPPAVRTTVGVREAPAFSGLSGAWAGYDPLAARRSVARGALGVVLSRRAGTGQDYFEVAIAFPGEQTATPIHVAADDSDVIARWRRYAEDLGLPLLIEDRDGRVVAPWQHIGLVQLGAVRIRRRTATLAARRPRFLMRRRPGLAVSA
ncbi:DUF6101 family protein [Alsobacter sp. R-9]